MNEQLIDVVSTMSGIDKAELTEKIKTDEGTKEVATKLSAMKVFKTEAEHLGFLDNFLKAKEQPIKDAAYAESKKTIHEKIEKDFKRKYGVEAWEHGKDYATTDEMIEKLIADKTKNSGTDTNEEIKKRDAKILELTKARDKELEDAVKPYSSEINELLVGNALELLRDRVDIDKEKVDGQLDFVKYQLSQAGYTIAKKDGKYIFNDKEGKPVVNDTYQPLSISQVIQNIAEANIPLKKSGPVGGRGGSNNPANNNNSDSIDFSLFTGEDGWSKFLQTDSGKRLTKGSSESNELFAKWAKATGYKL
jgi:hypothetical protein